MAYRFLEHTADMGVEVEAASYEAILRDYYPAESVLLGVFPARI